MAQRKQLTSCLTQVNKHNIKTNLFAHELRKQENLVFSS